MPTRQPARRRRYVKLNHYRFFPRDWVFDRQISLTISAEVNVQLAGSQIDFEPGGQLVTGACLRTAGIDL